MMRPFHRYSLFNIIYITPNSKRTNAPQEQTRRPLSRPLKPLGRMSDKT